MKILKFCNIFIKPYKKNMIIYFIISIIMGLFSVTIPYLSSIFLDSLTNFESKSTLINIMYVFVFCSFLSIILRYIAYRVNIKLLINITYDLNMYVIRHIQESPLKKYMNLDSAYLNQRINNDSNDIIDFTISVYVNLIQNIVTFISISILIYNINKLIFFINVISIVVYIFIYLVFQKKIFTHSEKYKETENLFFSNLQEQLTNIKSIKIHSLNKWFKDKIDNSFAKYIKVVIKSQKVFILFENMNQLADILTQVVLYSVAANEFLNGRVTIGVFTIIMGYYLNLKNIINYFSSLGKLYQQNLVSYNRIQELLGINKEIYGTKVIKDITSIEIKNICFKYDNKNILENINLTLKKGAVYCIVGENGCGKSTLLNIISGLYNNDYEGSIKINDININEINMPELRQQSIGVVEQDFILLDETIYNNISLGNSIDDSYLDTLIDKFNLRNLVNSLDDRLNTNVNKALSNFSGGERQKIAIIRALIKKPSLILLDEPTSALDIVSKEIFFNTINELKKDKIIIIISHDNYLINQYDEVIYL